MAPRGDFVHKQENLPYEYYKIFEDMRLKKEFCDVQLNVGDRCIYAHKVILAASIPYFRSSFGCNETESPGKEISLADVRPEALEVLIHFAYTCEVKITSENVHTLLTAACFLEVDNVKKACVDYIISGLSPADAVSVRNIGVRLNCPDLVCRTDDYIRENFDDVSHSEGFLLLPYSELKDLISCDNLHVASEEIVFEGMMRWIKAQPEKGQLELPLLLSCVRIPFLKLQYFREVVATDEQIRGSLKCRDILDDGRDYHLYLEKKCSAKKWRFSCVPRRYKGKNVCSVTAKKSELHSTMLTALEKQILNRGEFIGQIFSQKLTVGRVGYSSTSALGHESEELINAFECNSSRNNFKKSDKAPSSRPVFNQNTQKLRFHSNQNQHSQSNAVQRWNVRNTSVFGVAKKNYGNIPLRYVHHHPSVDITSTQNLIRKKFL